MKKLRFYKNSQSGSMPWQILLVLAIALVVPVTVFLVRQNQDIRQRADTATVACRTTGDNTSSLTRWGWSCEGTNVANRTSEYSAWQCPQNNVPSCTTHFGGVKIPLTCGNIENGQSSTLNCSASNGFLNVLLPQQKVYFNNPLPLGECGCVQTDLVVTENGTPAVAGGEIRCYPQACNMTQPPVCQIVSVEKTQIPIGDSSSIAFSASDPDNNLNKMEMWYGPVPSPNHQWTHMSPNKTSAPYEMTRDFTCAPEMAGKSYYVTCNAYDSAGNACSGNPVNDSTWWFRDCGPNDHVTVTCTNESAPLSCNQLSGNLISHSLGGGSSGLLTQSTPDLKFNITVGGVNINRTEVCFIGRKNPEGTQFTSAKCLRQVSSNTSFNYTGNPSVFTLISGTTSMAIPPTNGLTYNYIATQLGMTNQEKTYGINWGVNVLTVDTLCEGSTGKLLSRATGQQVGSCSVNASCKGALKTAASPTPSPRVSPTPSPRVSPTPSPRVSPTPSPRVSPTPSPRPSSTPPLGPRCQYIRIYKLNGPANTLSSWGNPLTAEELAAMSAEGTIRPGSQLYITVMGDNANSTPLISYQKGRIRVNVGSNQGGFVETSAVKPSDGNLRRIEYYVMYTIPQFTAQTAFTVEGEVCAAQGDSCTWH